jgi:hypothetical protein
MTCDERVNGEFVDDKPSTWVFEVIDRLWAPSLQNACAWLPMLNRGRSPFCVNGWSTTERRRKAPTVQPTFLLIIFTAATLSSPRVLGGCELGGLERREGCDSRLESGKDQLHVIMLAQRAKYGECAST